MLIKIFALISLLVFHAAVAQDEDLLEDFDVHTQQVNPKLGNATISEPAGFMASLRVRANDSPFGNGHVCGAVFISRRHLLTASHCIVKIERILKAEDLIVVAGSRSRYSEPGSHRFNISEIIIPSQYHRFPVMGMSWNVAILVVRIAVILSMKSLQMKLFLARRRRAGLH